MMGECSQSAATTEMAINNVFLSPSVLSSAAAGWDLTEGCCALTAVPDFLIVVVFVFSGTSEVPRIIFSWVLIKEG